MSYPTRLGRPIEPMGMDMFSPEARQRLDERPEFHSGVDQFEKNPYPREFTDFDWVKIASYLGATIQAKDRTDLAGQVAGGQVLMVHHKFGRIEIYDNGGELNLYAERPEFTEEQSEILSQLEAHNLRANRFFVWHKDVSSVPYTSTEGYVTNVTLAYRIRMFLLQRPIDWDWLEADPESWFVYRPERNWELMFGEDFDVD